MKQSSFRCSVEIAKRLSALSLLVSLAACGGGGGYGDGGQPPSQPPATFTIGGTVSGLNGSSVVLRNNGGNDLTISGNAAFTFSTALASGAAYLVTVATQPTNQICTVAQGSGTATANVTSVAVSCTTIPPDTFTIGGTASGMSGPGLVLRNNGGDVVTVDIDGPFTFPTPLTRDSNYAVTVTADPAGQLCTVANGNGTATAHVTEVAVTCRNTAAPSVAIRGTIVNLQDGGLILHNNDNNDGRGAIAVPAGSQFFSFRVAPGTDYDVTVAEQPRSQDCTVTDGSGTAGNTDVDNVVVTCGAMGPLTVTADPADGTANVPRSVQPTLTFSAPLDLELSGDSNADVNLQIVGEDDPIHFSAIQSELNQARLLPDFKLLPLVRHRMSASNFRGTRGEAMAGEFIGHFTTGDVVWKDVSYVSGQTAVTENQNAAVAIDAAGNALAAWRDENAKHAITVNRYDAASSTWGEPQQLPGGTEVFDPQLAMDEAGNALLVWVDLNSANPRYLVVWAARYSAELQLWEQPHVVSATDGSNNRDARIAVARDGEVVVVWKRSDPAPVFDTVWMTTSTTQHDAPWATRTLPSTLRERVDFLIDPVGDVTGSPVVAIAPNGERICVAWAKPRTDGDPTTAVWSRVYDRSGISIRPLKVSNSNGIFAVDPTIVVDNSAHQQGAHGDTYVAWRQHGLMPDVGRSEIWIARHDGTLWGAAARVTADDQVRAFNPRLATNTTDFRDAHTWLAWVEENNGAPGQVWSARVSANGLVRRKLEDAHREAQDKVNLVVDPAGNAFAVWKNYETQRLVSSRYSRLTDAWAAPVPVDNDTFFATGGSIGALAVNPFGGMVAVWHEANGNPMRLRSRLFD